VPLVLKTVLWGILSALGKVLMSMLTSLLTEKFLKRSIILALEKVSASTKSDVDDLLLKYAKEAWGPGENASPAVTASEEKENAK
jgi:hypothetical protein